MNTFPSGAALVASIIITGVAICSLWILEPQRGKEPSVFPCKVPLLEKLLDDFFCVLTQCRLLEGVIGNSAFETLELEGISGRQKVVVVDDLDKGLDLRSFSKLLCSHRLGDLEWVSLNAGNDGMGVRALLRAVIELLQNDDLMSRGRCGWIDG